MTKTKYEKKRAELKEVYKAYKAWGEACKAWGIAHRAINDLKASWAQESEEK